MGNKKIESVVVISYIPGLYAARAGETLEPSDMKDLANIEPHNNADACIWGQNEGGFFPVFLFDDAPAIYEHLMWWCNGHPDKWFKLALRFNDSGYALSLIPDLKRSASRWNYARKELHGKDPLDATKYVYSALSFMSDKCSVKSYLDEIKAQEVFKVGFVETSAVDPNNIDDDMVLFIEGIERDNSEMATQHMECALNPVSDQPEVKQNEGGQ